MTGSARPSRVLSDTELVRELREGEADAREGRVVPAEQIAADLAARRATECVKQAATRSFSRLLPAAA
jgi:predicted nucleic acid-binding protein